MFDYFKEEYRREFDRFIAFENQINIPIGVAALVGSGLALAFDKTAPLLKMVLFWEDDVR